MHQSHHDLTSLSTWMLSPRRMSMILTYETKTIEKFLNPNHLKIIGSLSNKLMIWSLTVAESQLLQLRHNLTNQRERNLL